MSESILRFQVGPSYKIQMIDERLEHWWRNESCIKTTTLRKNCPCTILFTTNSTWTSLDLNSCLLQWEVRPIISLVVIKMSMFECEIQGSCSSGCKGTVFLDVALCCAGKALLAIRTVWFWQFEFLVLFPYISPSLFSKLSLHFDPDNADFAFLQSICNNLCGVTYIKHAFKSARNR
jgi:hypothetical protein